jgi:hypothetical protein
VTKQLAILFYYCSSLCATTYYVGSTGSDSNTTAQAQVITTPWLTVQHSLNNMACGDTLLVIANGSYVTGDAILPYFSGCTLYTNILSSNLALFNPPGYRTNPANDSANYGKLQIAGSSGIVAQPEVHGSFYTSGVGNYGACNISSITSSVFTLGYCGSGLPNLVNGSQIEFELNMQGSFTANAIPAPLTILQHYYVVNCTGMCGTATSTLQVSATSGGTPITITACDSTCIAQTIISEPLQFTAGSSTITSPDTLTSYTNGTPVALAAVGFQRFGTLPTPFALDTVYYIVNVSGQTFGLAATSGGAAITATSVGLGPLAIANTNLPHHWRIAGLEFVDQNDSPNYNMLVLGSGNETSVLVGVVNHIEVDHNYFHDTPGHTNGPTRAIADNGAYNYFHDNYIAGMRGGEAQAIGGWGSPGPTAIINNFLEAGGENTLYGGNGSGSGTPNANKQFIGNYYYKPPTWKRTTNTDAPSGSCWWDNYDPNHSGGEWYLDSNTSTQYQCQSNFTWASTASSPVGTITVKNGGEHKNGQKFLYYGNLFNFIWASAQSGQAFNINQEAGSGPGLSNDHITVQNNQMTNVYQFTLMGSSCNQPSSFSIPCLTLPVSHAYINNLVVISLNACGVTFTTGSATCGFHMYETSWGGWPQQGMLFNHNTIYTGDTWSGLYPQNPQAQFMDNGSGVLGGTNGTVDNWINKNNIWSGDFNGGGGSPGCSTILDCYYTHSSWHHNVLLNGTASAYNSPGATNTFDQSTTAYPTANSTIAYTNVSTGDYHLTSSSPYSAANAGATLLSDDGTDLGADIDAINVATSGAKAGTPPSDRMYNVSITPGSINAKISYLSPVSTACTWSVYSSSPSNQARIAANLVGSATLDSGSTGVSDGLRREILYPSLSASTTYNHSLSCGGVVVAVGSFTTLASGSGSYTYQYELSTAATIKDCSDAAMSSGCVTQGAATRQKVSVASGGVRYVAWSGGEVHIVSPR